MAALRRQAEQHESATELDINLVYAREKTCEIPRYQLPSTACCRAPRCTTWMEPEAEHAPLEPGRFHLGAAGAAALCDENTIGGVVIMGSTMDGSYEPVAGVSAALDRVRDETGVDVPIRVDGASGGFVAPFLQPDLEWDFRVPRVAPINASGHKYGLVYPGVGWIVWRDAEALPEDLVFKVNYLGGEMPTFALNISRPGAHSGTVAPSGISSDELSE